METQLPREIQVIDLWPASVRFVLPKRPLGKSRWFAWLVVLFGLAAFALTVYLALAFAGQMPWVLKGFLRTAACILGLVTLGGTLPLWFGLAALFGHRELEIRGEYLRTIEQVGPLWRGSRIKIQTIQVIACDPTSNDVMPPAVSLDELTSLQAVLAIKKHQVLAWGYPEALLQPLAVALTERCNAALERLGLPRSVQSLDVVNAEGDEDDDEMDEDGVDSGDEAGWSELGEAAGDSPDDLEPALTQPAGSQIAVEKFEGGLTIRVPPAGVWKGSSGMFFFALLWNGAMTIFTSIMILAGVQSENQPDETALWVLPLVLVLFWAAGIGLLLGALNMGKRSAMFAVAAGNLLVMQKGIFGTKQREWPVEGITNIALGPSGMKVNDRDVLQLQIHGTGERLGLLTGRDETELEWLACELRNARRAAKSPGQPHAPSLKPPEATN